MILKGSQQSGAGISLIGVQGAKIAFPDSPFPIDFPFYFLYYALEILAFHNRSNNISGNGFTGQQRSWVMKKESLVDSLGNILKADMDQGFLST